MYFPFPASVLYTCFSMSVHCQLHIIYKKLSHKMYVAVSKMCLFSPEKVQVSCGRGVDSISHIMSGSERKLGHGHCVSDIGCIGMTAEEEEEEEVGGRITSSYTTTFLASGPERQRETHVTK